MYCWSPGGGTTEGGSWSHGKGAAITREARQGRERQGEISDVFLHPVLHSPTVHVLPFPLLTFLETDI